MAILKFNYIKKILCAAGFVIVLASCDSHDRDAGAAAIDGAAGQAAAAQAAVDDEALSELAKYKQKQYDESRVLNAGEVVYDCNFDIHNYYRYPAIKSFIIAGQWQLWLHKNMSGGLLKPASKNLTRTITRQLQNHRKIFERSAGATRSVSVLSIGGSATKRKESYIIIIDNQVVSFVHIPNEAAKRFGIDAEVVSRRLGGARCNTVNDKAS